MGGAWRAEDLAGEAVLELDHLLVDDDLLGAGWRPVGGGGRGGARIICEEEEKGEEEKEEGEGERASMDTPQRRKNVREIITNRKQYCMQAKGHD